MTEDASKSSLNRGFEKPKEPVKKPPLGLSLRRSEDELDAEGEPRISRDEKLVDRRGGHESLIERRLKIRQPRNEES